MVEKMTHFELLNSTEHADVRIITEHRARFGDAVMQVMAFPFEFRNLQACYPIFFQVDGGDNLFPIALLGFEEGENLFLNEPDWNAAYIPAMARRDPFLIGVADARTDAGETRQARMLSLDMRHPRVSREAGEALFKPLGGRTDFLEEQANLLETLHDGFDHCRAFGAALREAGLVESVTLEIALNDGSRNQLIGLHGIDEDKVKELSGDTLQRFNEQGFLMPLFMAIASLSNVQRLIELKNNKVAEAAG